MIVITGGAGFIGSVLLAKLNSMGCDDIIVVDNLGSTEKWRNLVKRSYRTYIHRDAFFEELSTSSLKDVTAIVHLGACSSTTERDCDFLYRNNVLYTKKLCTYALERGIRIIIASSAATYGDGSQGFVDDPTELAKLRPLNMYGYSKHLVDRWLWDNRLLDSVASLKFFNVYGPNEYHKGDMQSVVAKAYGQIMRHGSLALFASTHPDIADGEQKRDFVYVKDCAELIVWLLKTPSLCGIHNVGTGKARSFNDLGRAVFSALERECSITYIPMPETLAGKYQNYTCADMSWLEGLGAPVHMRDLEEGVRDYVCGYLGTADPYV
ncbi:MAG: ADP-glyceromanno-heptose 6-epimerase [Desulfovibrionaceae bacterium]|nr:ADP-glyceromanno-heptose 6-epimerase [Desulfovibrionaceae bacterium]